MSDFNETTADNLKAIRAEREVNQEEIAGILGITQTAVSKIESGARALGDSEKKLLDWHFFGTIPPRISKAIADPKTVLDFDEAEYRIIGTLARREGITEEQWIVSRIRSYLVFVEGNRYGSLKVADAPNPDATPSKGPVTFPSGRQPRAPEKTETEEEA